MPPPPIHAPDCYAIVCVYYDKLVIPDALTQTPNMAADRVQIALELGRLDMVTIALALLGAAAALFAFFGFLEIRYRAREVARETAEQIARKVALVELQKMLPSLVDDAVAFHITTQTQGVGPVAANQIAESVGNGEVPSKPGKKKK